MTSQEREKAIAWFRSRLNAMTMPGALYMFELALEALREQDCARDDALEEMEKLTQVLMLTQANAEHFKEERDAALAELEALRKQDGWRDAIKDPPEPHETVLVYLPGDNPFCKVREGRLSMDGTWHARLFDCEPGEVTYWRPMPKPPEKEGEKQ